jgi:hypothetical protein
MLGWNNAATNPYWGAFSVKEEDIMSTNLVEPCPPGRKCQTDCTLCKTAEEIRLRVKANYESGIIPEHILAMQKTQQCACLKI